MQLPRLLAACGLGCVALGAAAAGDVRPAAPTPTAQPPGAPARATVVDVVAPPFRDAVAQVVRQPTLSAKAAEEEFQGHPAVYDWLLQHPDRACLAWRRMGVACVDITDLGNGRFRWADGNGSDLTWQVVGRFQDGVVWYATGRVKAAALVPTAPVKAVAVLAAGRHADPKTGEVTFKPTLNVYFQTDSRAAAAVLRVIGPAAPRMAEQGAEQLLLFFSGPTRRIFNDPEEAPTLLAPPKAK